MKKLRKLIAMALATMVVTGALVGCGSKDSEETTTDGGAVTETKEEKVKVAVLLYKFDDTYISTVRQSLAEIAKDESKNVEFEFFDGKGDQSVQNDLIDTVIQKGTDLILLNLVDTGAGQTAIDKIKEAGVPVALFNREPAAEVIKSYEKAIFVGTNAAEAGVMQGEIVAELWESNKEAIDFNGDGKIQYVMLKGEPDNPEAVARTEFSVSTIKDKGIEVEELELQVANWQTDLAQNAMEAWLANHGEKGIELVLANNDGMAQGAIAALNAQEYNLGDAAKTVTVVGVDATAAAQELISKGNMFGSVLQDAPAMAEGLYLSGMNLVAGKSAIEGTEYKFDDTGVAIRIPYQPYVK